MTNMKSLILTQSPRSRLNMSTASSNFSSDLIFSRASREKCISRVKKMKSYRPSDVEVKQKAAVLGNYSLRSYWCNMLSETNLINIQNLVPLVDVGGEAHLLFTRRSLSLSSHSGQVSFPGGKEDPGTDIDLVHTALRFEYHLFIIILV